MKTQTNGNIALAWLMRRYHYVPSKEIIYVSWVDEGGRFFFLAQG